MTAHYERSWDELEARRLERVPLEDALRVSPKVALDELRELGLNLEDLAQLAQTDERTMRRWLSGEEPRGRSADGLLDVYRRLAVLRVRRQDDPPPTCGIPD